jgi:hypothetical protein
VAGLGGVFGEGSTARQLLVWQVLAQVIANLAAPAFTELAKLSNSAAPVMPLDVGVAAAAAARGHLSTDDARGYARQTGFDHPLVDIMTKVAQRAPDLSMAFELHRRKAIPVGTADGGEVSLRGALTDAGIPAAWHDKVAELAVAVPDQSQVLTAWLTGQIEAAEATDRLKRAGMDPEWIPKAYAAEGEAPTPTQALELLNRGIIPERGHGIGVVSYEQAFLEGPWRNKWLSAFLELRNYLPPPRTVTAMYHGGQLSHALAAELLRKQGLSASLAEAYLSKAASAHTATEKHLAKSEITALFADKLMTRDQALAALVAIKYTEHDAHLILDLVAAKAKASQTNQAVSRVRALYSAGKLDDREAAALLRQLGVDAAQVTAVIATWRLTQSHQTRLLTAAQVEGAWHYGVIDTHSAMTLLQGMGYDEFDAWVALSVRNHGPLTDYPRPSSPFPPPKGPAPHTQTGA